LASFGASDRGAGLVSAAWVALVHAVPFALAGSAVAYALHIIAVPLGSGCTGSYAPVRDG